MVGRSDHYPIPLEESEYIMYPYRVWKHFPAYLDVLGKWQSTDYKTELEAKQEMAFAIRQGYEHVFICTEQSELYLRSEVIKEYGN